MLSILNSLAEYFNMINVEMPSSEEIEIPELKPIYILYDNLEEVIDLERDLERYQKDTLRKIKPQQVYHMGMFESMSSLYRISREVELSV